MLSNYLKKAQPPNEDPGKTKANLAKTLGFYKIDENLEEYNNDSEEQFTKNNSKDSPIIHEEIIRVVNESYHESSLNCSNLEEKIENLGEPNKKTTTEILPTYKKSIDITSLEKTKIMNSKNDVPIHFLGQTKKIAMSGILGMLKPSKPELSAVFCPQGNASGTDDFTETFFGLPPPVICTGTNGQDNANAKTSPWAAKLISSSLLELDDSNNQAGLMDSTPINKAKINKEGFEKEALITADLPFSSVSGKHEINPPKIITEKTWKKQEVAKKNNEVFMQETNDLQKNSLVGLDRANKGDSPQREVANKKFEEKGDKLEKKDIETVQEIYEEKFILKMGEISSESINDVLPRKSEIKEGIPVVSINIANVKPPYKLKVIYIPTEWPVEVPVDEDGTEKTYSQSNITETLRNSPAPEQKNNGNASVSCYGDTKSQFNGTKSRKVTKKKPKSKKDKKKSKKSSNDDASSKLSASQKKKIAPSVVESKNPDAQTIVSQIDKKTEKVNPEEDKQSQVQSIDKNKENNGNESIKSNKEIPWSGQEVLQDSCPYAAIWLTDNLSSSRLWQHGYKGWFTYIRWLVKKFICSQYMENFMNLLVLLTLSH